MMIEKYKNILTVHDSEIRTLKNNVNKLLTKNNENNNSGNSNINIKQFIDNNYKRIVIYNCIKGSIYKKLTSDDIKDNVYIKTYETLKYIYIIVYDKSTKYFTINFISKGFIHDYYTYFITTDTDFPIMMFTDDSENLVILCKTNDSFVKRIINPSIVEQYISYTSIDVFSSENYNFENKSNINITELLRKLDIEKSMCSVKSSINSFYYSANFWGNSCYSVYDSQNNTLYFISLTNETNKNITIEYMNNKYIVVVNSITSTIDLLTYSSDDYSINITKIIDSYPSLECGLSFVTNEDESITIYIFAPDKSYENYNLIINKRNKINDPLYIYNVGKDVGMYPMINIPKQYARNENSLLHVDDNTGKLYIQTFPYDCNCYICNDGILYISNNGGEYAYSPLPKPSTDYYIFNGYFLTTTMDPL